jgi:hypothetical protein
VLLTTNSFKVKSKTKRFLLAIERKSRRMEAMGRILQTKWVTIFLLQFLTVGYLGSQEIPFYSLLTQMPWSSQTWETSYSIPRNDPQFLQAIAIPFAFPKETALLYSYRNDSMGIFSGSSDNAYGLGKFWDRNQVYQGQRGIAFLYRKKNFGLNLDMTLQIAGNDFGQRLPESSLTKIRTSYRVPSKWIGLKDSATRVELFLELSELNQFGNAQSLAWQKPYQSTLLKSAENTNRPSLLVKQLYVNPGVSVSTTSNFIFEGQVRIPMNAREAYRTLDQLWAPEIQTNLGMKYLFPEK